MKADAIAPTRNNRSSSVPVAPGVPAAALPANKPGRRGSFYTTDRGATR